MRNIYGIGVDLVRSDRIARIYQRFGIRFSRRVLTNDELIRPAQHFSLYLAKQYAAKEAYAKAMGCGIGAKLSFQDIEIMRDKLGRPYFSENTNLPDDHQGYVSISDEKTEAGFLIIAMVVIEKIQS